MSGGGCVQGTRRAVPDGAPAWVYVERSTGHLDAVGPYESLEMAYGAMAESELIDAEAQSDAYEMWVAETTPDEYAAEAALRKLSDDDGGCDDVDDDRMRAARAATADPDTLLGVDDDYPGTERARQWAATVEGIGREPATVMRAVARNLARDVAGVTVVDDDEDALVLDDGDGTRFEVVTIHGERGAAGATERCVTAWTWRVLEREPDGAWRSRTASIHVGVDDHLRLVYAMHGWARWNRYGRVEENR